MVVPWLSGGGCDTCGVSATVTVRLDCATATVETRTSLPMTMMPEFSSMMILAAWSVSITSCSTSVSRSTMLPLKFCGRVIRTVAGSSGVAQGVPMKSLIDSATRRAVVRSGFLSARRSVALRAQREGDLALDQAARGDAASGGDAGDDAGGVAGGLEAVDGPPSPGRSRRPRRRRQVAGSPAGCRPAGSRRRRARRR